MVQNLIQMTQMISWDDPEMDVLSSAWRHPGMGPCLLQYRWADMFSQSPYLASSDLGAEAEVSACVCMCVGVCGYVCGGVSVYIPVC